MIDHPILFSVVGPILWAIVWTAVVLRSNESLLCKLGFHDWGVTRFSTEMNAFEETCSRCGAVK